jgi:hypothetical protein
MQFCKGAVANTEVSATALLPCYKATTDSGPKQWVSCSQWQDLQDSNTKMDPEESGARINMA